MKATLSLILFLLILNDAEINANLLEKEYIIHNVNPKITARLTYLCSATTTISNHNTFNLEPENLNFNFTKMIATFK